MTHKPLLLVALGALIALSMFAVACGDDDDDDTGTSATATEAATGSGEPTEPADTLDAELPSEADVLAYFEAAADTINGGDFAGFVALFSDKGLAEFTFDTETPSEELRQQAADFLEGGPMITVTSVENIEPFERNIGVDVNSIQGGALAREYFELLPYQGSYLIDAYQRNSPDIPEGTTSVITSATEFQYDFVTGDPNGDGNIAFVLNNDGQQPHEIIVFKVAEGPTLDELVDIGLDTDPSDLPPEIEEVVGSTFAPPSDTSTLAFPEPLASGRYAIMCFVPDEDGIDHAAKGMAAEFTVQ